jgi:hypothetical protein
MCALRNILAFYSRNALGREPRGTAKDQQKINGTATHSTGFEQTFRRECAVGASIVKDCVHKGGAMTENFTILERMVKHFLSRGDKLSLEH